MLRLRETAMSGERERCPDVIAGTWHQKNVARHLLAQFLSARRFGVIALFSVRRGLKCSPKMGKKLIL
jgi:hypothetical protein